MPEKIPALGKILFQKASLNLYMMEEQLYCPYTPINIMTVS